MKPLEQLSIKELLALPNEVLPTEKKAELIEEMRKPLVSARPFPDTVRVNRYMGEVVVGINPDIANYGVCITTLDPASDPITLHKSYSVGLHEWEHMLSVAICDPRPPPRKWTLEERLTMRLDAIQLSDVGIEKLAVMPGRTKVYVLLLHGDEVALIEDDKKMFPTDTCVSKIYLFKETHCK